MAKRTGGAVLVSLALFLSLLSGCGLPQPESSPPEQPGARLPGPAAEYRRQLTEFQVAMLEDYSFLWQVLEEDYPYWGLIQRMGIDAREIRRFYRKEVASAETEEGFFRQMKDMIECFRGVGHLALFDGEYYRYHRDVMAAAAIRDNAEARCAPWNAILADPDVAAAYRRLDGGGTDGEAAYSFGSEPPLGASYPGSGNLDLVIEEEGRIARIEVKSMLFETDLYDHYALLNLYGELREYEHVIFDISMNGGGDDHYWMDNIAAPNLDKPALMEHYMLWRGSEWSLPFLEACGYAKNSFYPSGGLPPFENLDRGDVPGFPWFGRERFTVDPEGKLLQGKLWVITSGFCYSSADNFASFCKRTGFATVIGNATDGGGGIQPILLKLPNSGLVLRYSCQYGLNPDGSCNEEFGTAPEIELPQMERKNLVRACVDYIRDYEEE